MRGRRRNGEKQHNLGTGNPGTECGISILRQLCCASVQFICITKKYCMLYKLQPLLVELLYLKYQQQEPMTPPRAPECLHHTSPAFRALNRIVR